MIGNRIVIYIGRLSVGTTLATYPGVLLVEANAKNNAACPIVTTYYTDDYSASNYY